jgi:hypothetical protein
MPIGVTPGHGKGIRMMKKKAGTLRKAGRDTRMPAAGAEHYVVAQLMFRSIDAFKSERGRAGTDVVAADPKRGTSVSIQVEVESGWPHSAVGCSFKKPAADFVVFARLNLDAPGAHPDCYVLPADLVRVAIEVGPSDALQKCHLARIENFEQYRDAWHLIRAALKAPRIPAMLPNSRVTAGKRAKSRLSGERAHAGAPS